ncbi:MAG TPA: site-specific integrase [Lachnospiraceae bacterium]|nr:site-specific integrase [Lachnospiraceae bacterium]
MPAYYDESTKTWFCKFYYTDYTGAKKQKKKRGFKLQREAKEWERNFLERLQGTPDMTFQALYDIYIDDMRHRLRPGTVKKAESVFRNRILPYFKDKPISSITPADIRAWQNTQIDAGYSSGYLEQIHIIMSILFNYAVSYYNLPSNPCKKAGGMGKQTRSMNFWTLAQYTGFIQHVTDIAAHAALQLLFYSGMRFGEMMALTLADFDFQANTISVSKTLHHASGCDTVGPPKTANGNRVISMPAAIMQEVQAYAAKIYGMAPEDRVFTFTDALIRGNIKRYSEKAGIPRIRIHDIRHSHVSLLIDMGFTPHLIAERIGDTVQMVNSTYGHLYPSKHAEVAEKLNRIIVPN